MSASEPGTAPPFRHPLIFWDVDTQVDFMHEAGALYVPGAESLVDRLAQLTEFAAQHRIPVVASADDHENSDEEISLEPDFASTYPPHCMRGTAGAERVPATWQSWSLEAEHELVPRERLDAALAVEQPRILILKKTVDVFSNPNTETVLEALDPARIAVYGVALDICNRMAVEGLLERGRRVALVTDASLPIDPDKGKRLLAEWAKRGVELTTTAALIASLEA